MKFILLLVLRWTLIEFWMISLYISLGSHRYGTLEGNLAYVPVMDPGFGSWQIYPNLSWPEIYISITWDQSP